MKDLLNLMLRLHGRGFQSKRFHDLETASNTTFRQPISRQTVFKSMQFRRLHDQ